MSALTRNHFALFGLPEQFAIVPDALDDAYRRVQRAVHPDRFTAASDSERRLAMQLAAQANEAYRTLRSPTTRAAYLCALNGIDPAAHNGAALAPDFLVQQMEWRERLESASEARSPGEVAALRAELEDMRARLITSLSEALDQSRTYERAADSVRRLMFIDRFADEVDALEHRLMHA